MNYRDQVSTIAYIRDVTERKHYEEMLQESEGRLNSIIQALPDLLFHISRDGTFLNEPMGHGRVLEYYPSISAAKTLYDLLPDEFASESLKVIRKTLDKGTLQLLEHSVPFPPGTTAIYETRIIPLGKDEVLAISRDITDKKLSEERLRSYQQQLQSLTSELSRTEERERRRLAADLHDLIGQSLAVIKMKLNPWKDVLYSSGQSSEMIKVLDLLDSTINNTRSLTFDLSPPVLYELGIEAGLESLLEKFHELHAIQYEYKDDGKEKPLEDEICILLYRCTSELLMNVVKHAEAQLVRLSISREDSQVSITLADDGVGFAVSETEVRGQGFGLFSIQERLNWVGGSFKLKSRPGGGTQATLKAPLKYTENSAKGKK